MLTQAGSCSLKSFSVLPVLGSALSTTISVCCRFCTHTSGGPPFDQRTVVRYGYFALSQVSQVVFTPPGPPFVRGGALLSPPLGKGGWGAVFSAWPLTPPGPPLPRGGGNSVSSMPITPSRTFTLFLPGRG